MRWLLLGLLALGGCWADADPTDLRGSVSRIYPLGFDQMRARLGASELAIQYVAADGQVPVQVVLRGGYQLDPGDLALPMAGDVVGGRDGRELPRVVSGTVELEAVEPVDGGRVRGSFAAELEGGYSLVGRFDAEIEAAR